MRMDEQAPPRAAMEDNEDPYAWLLIECTISPDQEYILRTQYFAFTEPDPLAIPVNPNAPVSSSNGSSGIAISSIEDEFEEVSSHKTTKIVSVEIDSQDERERAGPSENPLIRNDVFMSPRVEELAPAPSMSNQIVGRFGEGYPNTGSDSLETVGLSGLEVPRPR